MPNILAIDQGTTGSTALIFNEQLQIIGRGYEEFAQIFPKPGWVEHQFDDIWTSVENAIKKALINADFKTDKTASIDVIGITNQRETVGIFDSHTLKPIHNAIVWQCRRTTEYCETLKQQGKENIITQKTGLLLDPYFSASKIHWLIENIPSAKNGLQDGSLRMGTVDTFLLNKLTSGLSHATDVSNASRTSLMSLDSLQWDDDLLDIFHIPKQIKTGFPNILSSSEVFGKTKNLPFLKDGIPIGSLIGDQQSALFGQFAFESSQAKCTYGTGAFLVVNTGTQKIFSQSKLLTTIAWKYKNQTFYALEGSVFIAGAVVQWLRDGLKIIESSKDIETLANTVSDTAGVIFVPAFTGLGAPHWNPHARGIIHGITRGTSQAHVARAALEGIALQCAELMDGFEKDLQKPISRLKVDGGASANNLLMQMQADFSNTRLLRPKNVETTAKGAAMLAGLAVGIFETIDSLKKLEDVEREFLPKISSEKRVEKIKQWKNVVSVI